jgi:AcrR family transcriptional regulator
MPRPSRNVDVLLLQAGREMFPSAGVRGLSVRKVAERAGVNLGMFHYHFRTKHVFVHTLLQQLYDDMFTRLELAAGASVPIEALRGALNVLGRFARDNALLLRRLVADALADEPLAVTFFRANMPRHVGVLIGLVEAAQRTGDLKPVAVPQALAFLAGGIAAPLIVGAALGEHALLPPIMATHFARSVASDDAIAERVDCALQGLALARPKRRNT